MSIGILDVAVNDVAGGRVVNPLAGRPFYVGLGWGPGANAAVTTALSCAGATIDTTFALGGFDPNLNLPGYTGFDLGWHPDNVPVYLRPFEAAYGRWKMTFPSAGTYTLALSGIGTASVTAIDAPAAPVLPTLKLIQSRPMGTLASQLFEVSFNGTYPDGGFVGVDGNLLGLATPFFAHIQDTATLRFAWSRSDETLHVFNSSGEVSGAVDFTTAGIWHGSAN